MQPRKRIRAYADYSPENPDTNLIKEAIQQFRQALNEIQMIQNPGFT